MMTLDSLHAMASGITPVAIHLESHMLWHRTLLESANEQLSELFNSPFSWRRLDQ